MLNIDIENFETIDSTNDQAMFQIEQCNLKKDKIIVSRQQTNGHGSNGREFVSDNNVGIYFTYIHFYRDSKELSFITQKTAVAIYTTFKEVFNIELSIKWINDLYYNGKKVAGILCRNSIKHKAVIVGIGIDLFYNKSLNDKISDIAGFIFKDTDELISTLESNKLIDKQNIVYKSIYNDFKDKEVYAIDLNSKWKADSLVLQIVSNIVNYINIEDLPSLYIEKNIIKGEKIYEDCILEC